MLIEKVDDGKKFPRCLACNAVLYHESDELTHSQKATEEKWAKCDHEFVPVGYEPRGKCVKCGFSSHSVHIPMARLMRCPVCATLYHVEGD